MPIAMTYSIRSARTLFLLAACAFVMAMSGRARAAEKSNATQLIALVKSNSPRLRDAITATFEAKDLKEGTAWAGRGPEFFFALEARGKPQLLIDSAVGPPMQRLAGSDLWYAAARIEQLGK